MTLPRRRSSRPRGRARLAITGDFPAADHDITEAMQAIPPAPWDGITWHQPAGTQTVTFGGASDIGVMPGEDTEPVTRSRGVMKVYPPGPTPRGLKAAVYIETEVGVLEDDGKLYDADASDAIARKAARRLRGSRRPWEPGEEHQREIARIFGGDVA
jgi:hypothetical protein